MRSEFRVLVEGLKADLKEKCLRVLATSVREKRMEKTDLEEIAETTQQATE